MPDDPSIFLDVLRVSVSILSCIFTVPLIVDIKVVGTEVGLTVVTMGSEDGVAKGTILGHIDVIIIGVPDGNKDGILVGSE